MESETKQQDKSVEDKMVLFNLGLKQLEIIGMLLSISSNALVGSNAHRFYNSLLAIKQQIIARLSKQEREDLVKLEVPILKYLNNRKDSWGNTKSTPIFAELLQYDTMIKELLEKKGFLVPTKESSGSLFDKTYEG